MILKFKNPKKKQIVVFDGESLIDLKYILRKKKFFLIENRKERIKIIYCSFSFILFCILNFFILFFKTRNLHTVYLYTLIKKINPKIVLTAIDNSFKFSILAKLLEKKIKFIAFQNANRFDYQHNYYLFKKNIRKSNFNSKYFIPNFFCYGEHEIKECKKYKINVKKFYPLGSLRLANFFHYLKINKIKLNKKKYDICLISEPVNGLNKRFNISNMEKSFANIARLTIKYCKKNNLKFIFLYKRFEGTLSHNLELNFYKKFLNDNEFNFLKKNSMIKRGPYSSYLGLFQSKVAIGGYSTLLREKIACDEKILSMNMKNNNLLEFPINGVCKLKNFSYEEFEKRLNLILKLNIKKYIKSLDRPTSYIMNYKKKFNLIKKINDIIF